jgi:glycerol uptake facilitator-like aquaporin
MRALLEKLAFVVAVLTIALWLLTGIAYDALLGTLFVCLIGAVIVVAVRHRRRYRHFPFASPDFLAVFGAICIVTSPDFQDVQVMVFVPGGAMLVLSVLILAASGIEAWRRRGARPGAHSAGGNPEAAGPS